MRLIHQGKCTDMWNSCFRQHSTTNCLIPHFTVIKEVKKGLCWSQALKCVRCGYTSKLFKLYDEVPSLSRGPKVGIPNIGLAMGLQDTTIGNTKANLLFTYMNTPPPSKSAMQTLSNKAGKAVMELNEGDLEHRCATMKETNRLRGLPEDVGIGSALDGLYLPVFLQFETPQQTCRPHQ